MASLGIEEEVYTHFRAAQRFDSAEAFVSYMEGRHLKSSCEDGSSAQESFREAVLQLAGYVQLPILELFLGNEGLYNPVPVLWLGASSNNSSVAVGFMSSVVWT
ncbi:MAG: hypothetical protein WDW38_006227 [Sanguina aurantia]